MERISGSLGRQDTKSLELGSRKIPVGMRVIKARSTTKHLKSFKYRTNRYQYTWFTSSKVQNTSRQSLIFFVSNSVFPQQMSKMMVIAEQMRKVNGKQVRIKPNMKNPMTLKLLTLRRRSPRFKTSKRAKQRQNSPFISKRYSSIQRAIRVRTSLTGVERFSKKALSAIQAMRIVSRTKLKAQMQYILMILQFQGLPVLTQVSYFPKRVHLYTTNSLYCGYMTCQVFLYSSFTKVALINFVICSTEGSYYR